MNHAMNTYAFWSHSPQLLSPQGGEIHGVPCDRHRGTGTHYVYVLTLDDAQVAGIRESPWLRSQKHFGHFRLSKKPECAAIIDGKSVRPKAASDGGPIPMNSTRTRRSGRSRTPKAVWRPIPTCPEHRQFVAEVILDIATRAQANPSLRSAARLLLHSLLWHWTADGVPTDTLELEWRGRDRLKYSFQHLSHSREAHESFITAGKKGLIHEHVVPRHLLVTHLLDQPPSDAALVIEFLQRYCRGAIVTSDQDRDLDRDSMPLDKKAPHTAWSFDGPYCDPYARYESAKFDLHRTERVREGACAYCGLELPT